MAAAFYYGTDDRLVQILNEFFKTRKEEAGEAHSVTRAADLKKFDEAFAALQFDVVFIETASLDRSATDWLTAFKKKYPNYKTSIVLIGDERDPSKVIKLIEGGFVDYIFTPPDKPLIIEKFMLYSTGKRNSDIRQVYSMKMNQPSDLARPGTLEELSEFDCKIRSSQNFNVGDMVILYAAAFTEDAKARGSVVGRCYASKDHDGFKGQFLTSFFFVGATPDILTAIRNSLRKSYAASKGKS
jgi:DNA-binding NarL/FixJ family response regulator